MIKYTKPVIALAALGFGLTACGGGNVRLTPQPHNTGTSATVYTQIERLSRPAIKEVFEPFQDHQISNAIEPYADTTIKNDIKVTEDALRPPSTTYNTDYGATLAGLLYPDEYTVNLAGTEAPLALTGQYFLSYELSGGTSFGGRAPNDDVIDLELGALFGNDLTAAGVTDDKEENDCLTSQNLPAEDSAKKTTSTFPYLPVAR
jgi:hypothetical protein